MRTLGKNGAKFKQWSKLGVPSDSRKQGLFLVEGKGPLETLSQFPERCEAILVREGYRQLEPWGETLTYEATDEVFQRISQVEHSPGLCGIARIPNEATTVVEDRVLVLEGLQEPGNLGTLLRSAWAFGFFDVWCIQGVYPFHPKVVRAAAGAHFFLRIREGKPDPSIVKRWVVGDIAGSPVDLNEEGSLGICLTNESQGLAQAPFVMDLKSHKVKIPMTETCESLNVAMAGSILMHRLSLTK